MMLTILSLVVFVEFFLLCLLIFFMFFINCFLKHKEKNNSLEKKHITQCVSGFIKHKSVDPFYLSQEFTKPLSLLLVLEEFNSRFHGGDFLTIKEDLSERFLLPLARKKHKSYFWSQRHFSARCFALCPLAKDAGAVFFLIKDSVSLVHTTAAIAAVHLEDCKALLFMLKKIGRTEDAYCKCYYRDLFLRGSYRVFQYIEEVSMEEKDTKVHIACLDILSAKIAPVNHELLQRDLLSSSSEIRNATLRVYARNPQKDSEKILLKAIESSEEEVRKEAAYGLGLFSSEASLIALKKTLEDLCLSVRLQAAESLKKIGDRGIAILNLQKNTGSCLASEIAAYVLEFQ